MTISLTPNSYQRVLTCDRLVLLASQPSSRAVGSRSASPLSPEQRSLSTRTDDLRRHIFIRSRPPEQEPPRSLWQRLFSSSRPLGFMLITLLLAIIAAVGICIYCTR